MKIMIADDEQSLRLLVQCIAEDNGLDFCCASNGKDAIRICLEEQPDLLILDIMMPKVDGFEVCRQLRANLFRAPILFLSARGDIVDKSVGFNAGGDDYLVKPFDTDELTLRIKALLRRRIMDAERDFGLQSFTPKERDVVIDPKSREVLVRGEKIDLTPKEFQILHFLVTHPGEVLAQEVIIREVWGCDFVGTNLNLAVYIRHIREKIEVDPSNPEHLQTVWGVGYRYKE